MTGFNCLICNNCIAGICNQIKTEGKCQLLCNVLQTEAGSFFDLDDLRTTVAGSWQICPECDAKLVQLDHYLEQLSTIQASIERIQNEIREDSIKSQLARKTKHEPVEGIGQGQGKDQQLGLGLDVPLSLEDSFNYNDSNDQDFNFDNLPIDELESEQGNETDKPNKIGHYEFLDREVRIILEPLNLPAGVSTFNLKTDKEIINYVKRNQVFIKKSFGGGNKKGKKKNEIKENFKCDFKKCKRSFSGINFLIAHKKEHSKNSIYSCDYCSRIFKFSYSLGAHLREHGIGDSKKLEELKCKLCGTDKIYLDRYKLNRHLEQHENRSFNSICEICGEEISGYKYKMDNHLQKQHGIGEGLVKCPKCPIDQFYKLGSKAHGFHMAHHLRLENKDQQVSVLTPRFFCEFCTSAFVSRSKFEEHKLRKHISPGLKEKCEYEECGQEFTTKDALTRHIKAVHQKLYKCTYPGCKKEVYSSNNNLKIHIKVHHLRQKDFKCTKIGCDKAFYTISSLKYHIIATHSQIKPFKCSYKPCSKAFAIKSHLTRHELLHTGVIRFVCEFCSEGYTIKESLRIHIQSKHKDPNTIIVGNNPRKKEYTRRPKVKVLEKSDQEII